MADTKIDDAIKSGVQAHQAGDIVEAERHYTSIIAQQPKHPDANHNMGILTLGLGQAEKSLPFFETALAANPSIEQFWLSYITALLTSGQTDVAKDNINKAKLANLSESTVNKLENLLRETTDVLPLDPPQEDIEQLISFYNDQKFTEIIPKAEKIINQYPNHLMTWNVLGAANQALGILKRAEEAFKKVTEIDPSYPDGFNNLGVAQQDLNKIDAAIIAFNKAINLRPDYAQAHYNLGVAYQGKDKLTEAIAYFEKAILLKSDYADAYFMLGILQQEGYDPQKAVTAYEKALQHGLKSAQIHNNLATLLHKQGHLNRAISEATKAVKLDPNYAQAFYNLGTLYQNNDEIKKAKDSLEKALEAGLVNTELFNNLASVNEKAGDVGEAIGWYEKAVELNPSHVSALRNFGNCLARAGDLNQATAKIKKVIQLQPEYAEAHYDLGNLYLLAGEVKNAAASYKKCLTYESTHEACKHMLAAITGYSEKRTAPRSYVENLFDRYAVKFDQALTLDLDYKIPLIVAERVQSLNEKFQSALDLGCGTGLLGAEIRKHFEYLEGIDLSKQMLNVAESRKVYDKLSHTDILAFLKTNVLNFDYFFALDVFIYVGDLDDVFGLIKKNKAINGRFVFSTEHNFNDYFNLESSGRFSHSKQYISDLCNKHSYGIEFFKQLPLRKDSDCYIDGAIYELSL